MSEKGAIPFKMKTILMRLQTSHIFSRESRLYKSVCPSVRRSVGPSRVFFFWCPNLRENELVTEKEYREGEASRD